MVVVMCLYVVLVLNFLLLSSQVRQRARVLRPVPQHFWLWDEHLSHPADLWFGRDACTHNHPFHPQPLTQDLPASFPSCGRHGLSADRLHPQWYGHMPVVIRHSKDALCYLNCFTFLWPLLDLSVVKTILAMIGKFGITASLSIIYVYSAEVFPTVIRWAGLNKLCLVMSVSGL